VNDRTTDDVMLCACASRSSLTFSSVQLAMSITNQAPELLRNYGNSNVTQSQT